MVDTFASGVEKKIIGQYEAMRRLRDTSLYLLMNEKPDEQFSQEIAERKIRIIYPELWIQNPIARRKIKLELIYNRIIEESPNKETVIYFRYPLADPSFLKFIKRMNEYCIVTEHQIPEKRLFLNYKLQWRLLGERIWGKRVRKQIDGFVGVTKEILDFEKKKARSHRFVGITIGNGVSAEDIKVREYEVHKGNTISLLFVGTPYPPHGLIG